MPAAPTPLVQPRPALRILIVGVMVVGAMTVLAGCVGSQSVASGATAAASGAAPSSTRAPFPTPSATIAPTAAPSGAPATLDPLALPLVAAGQSLSAGTEGLAPLEARASLDQATTVLQADAQVTPVDQARIAGDIAALYAATHSVREGVVETAIRVVNDEAPNADAALRDALVAAITEQQAQTSATDDTPRQVLALVSALQAVQDSEAAFAAQQQAASGGEQAPDGGGTGTTGNHTVPPTGGDGTETYCADPSHPGFCVPIGPVVPVG